LEINMKDLVLDKAPPGYREAFDRLVRYAIDDDTGGLIAYDMIRALVPNPVIVDRLHDAGLLHYAFDVAGCGCRGYARAGYMTLHSFRNLAAITGVGHGMAATG